MSVLVRTLLRSTTGTIKSTAGELLWISLNVDDGGGYIELTDDTTGSGSVVYRMDRDYSDHMNFSWPMQFTTGIYLKTIGACINAIFGYR